MSEGVRLSLAAAALMVGATCGAIALDTERRGTEMSRWGSWSFVAAATLLVGCIPLEALNATDSLGPTGLLGVAVILMGALSLTFLGRTLAHRAASLTRHIRLTYAGPVSAGVLRGRIPAGMLPAEDASVLVSTLDEHVWIELSQN